MTDNDAHKTKISVMIEQGYQLLENLKNESEIVEEVQRTVLTNILSENKDTEYGNKNKFSSIESFEDYCACVPVSDWDTYREYVSRMIHDGENGLLFRDEVYWYAYTSGTTGTRKHFPMSKTSIAHCGYMYIYRGLALADREYFKKSGKHLTEGKVFFLIGGVENSTEKWNQSYGSVILANIKYLKKEFESLCVPPEYILLQKPGDIGITFYIFLRYGLMCKKIVYMMTIYDQYMINMFSYLKVFWKELCDDIEKGIIGEWSGISKESIEKYKKEFLPDPQRAEELRRILSEGFDDTTLRKIWPDLILVSAMHKVDTMENEIKLKDYIGDIPYDNSPYGSTECLMAVRTRIDEDMTLIPNACVYEFLPEGVNIDSVENTKKLWELEIGHSYELIITTYSGLYRYKTNDVLEVVGKKGNCPLVRFVARKGVVLNLFAEKTTEKALRDAITVSAVKRRISLKGYSVYGEIWYSTESVVEQGRYVVQFETMVILSEDDKELFAKEIDRQICNTNSSYKAVRNDGRMHQIRVEELKAGSYKHYDESRRTDNGMDEQYKRPLKLKLATIIKDS